MNTARTLWDGFGLYSLWQRVARTGRSPALMIAIWLTLMLFISPAEAQTSRGAISGTVTDGSGAVIAGAKLVLTHTETGVHRSTLSNHAGIYRFDAVDLGIHELRATHPGFKLFLKTAVGAEANRTTTQDVRLEVGALDEQVTVSAETGELLARDGPLRGGAFRPREIRNLPLISFNPLSLARTLPGIIHTSGSVQQTRDSSKSADFSVDGQRVRGNNFLLDGADNNDIAFTGVAQPFNIADAVAEVSVQTGNFSVEFGRASGGVFNVVTKSGTNAVHGTVYWRYQSQRFNSVSNLDKLNQIPKSVYSHNVPGFTVGGPMRRNRTFFFGGFQQDTRRSTTNISLTVPTAAAVERLRALFPSNPRLDLYLGALGELRGTGAPLRQTLGLDPQTGADRGSIEFAAAPLALPDIEKGPQWLVRVDHHQSDAHRLSWRYIRDSRLETPNNAPVYTVNFPGFILDSGERNRNFLFTDSY